MAKRMALPPHELEALFITPPPFPQDFDVDSVDLRLGRHFFVPKGHRAPCFCPGLTEPEHLYDEQYIPMGTYLVLSAHSTILGATLEFIKLPCDMAGQILTKSSWARTFITIETAPWIHPLYRGCLTLEIANASNTPIVLYPGVKIAQLVLLGTESSRIRKDRIGGSYIGPVRPEPGIIAPPDKFLPPLGVQENDIVYPFESSASPKKR